MVPEDAARASPGHGPDPRSEEAMSKPLRGHSRRKLREGLARTAPTRDALRYGDYESELRRRQSRLISILMTTVVACNALFVLADIVIRLRH